MQLLNGTSRNGSVVFELMISLVLIAGVSVGMYELQHTHNSMQQPSTLTFYQ